MNKENIEPKNLIEGNVYLIDAKFNNSGNVRLIKKGKLISTVQDLDSGMEWETMTNRLSEVKSTAQPPAISSNEGEKVELSNVQEEVSDFDRQRLETYSLHLEKEKSDSWQYMDDLKAAFEAGIENEHRCPCGKCDYCIDIQSDDDGPD